MHMHMHMHIHCVLKPKRALSRLHPPAAILFLLGDVSQGSSHCWKPGDCGCAAVIPNSHNSIVIIVR